MSTKVINRTEILFPILLVLYEMINCLSNDAYLPALPAMTHDLATTNHLAIFSITVWFFGSSSMQLILGPLADRFGRRPVLLIGGIVFVITTLICALSHNIHLLLAARLIQGATFPSMIVPGYAVIHELFDHDRAIYTLAWMNSITVLAPALGPLFGAVVIYFVSWRWIFLLITIAVIPLLLALYVKMPETNPSNNTHPIQIKRILHQYGRIIINPNYMRTTLCLCCLFAAMIVWISIAPFLIVEKFHYDALIFGIIQALVFGSFIVTARMVKRLMKVLTIAILVKSSLIIALAASVISILLLLILPHALFIIVITIMLIAAASGICFPILNRTAMEYSSEPMGVRVAIFSSCINVSGMLGSAIISSIYNNKLSTMAIVLTALCLFALLFRGFGEFK